MPARYRPPDGKPVVIVRQDHTRELARQIEELTDLKLMIGIPIETSPRDADDEAGPAFITNAQLGYIHEHGAPEAGIPPRPFLGPGVSAKRSEIIDALRRIGRSTLSRPEYSARVALEALGLKLQAAVRRYIISSPFVPLAESTLAARAARGVKRTKPLIDTGALLASITYVVRTRNGRDVAIGQRQPLAGTAAAREPRNVEPTRQPNT